MPSGIAFATGTRRSRWSALTWVGKCAWYWNAFNTRIKAQLDRISRARQKTIRLEGFTFEVYEKLLEFLDVKKKIPRTEFTELARRKPNRSEDEVKNPGSWTTQEQEEFEAEIAPFAKVAGYR